MPARYRAATSAQASDEHSVKIGVRLEWRFLKGKAL
jgi:hypothetical protein